MVSNGSAPSEQRVEATKAKVKGRGYGPNNRRLLEEVSKNSPGHRALDYGMNFGVFEEAVKWTLQVRYSRGSFSLQLVSVMDGAEQSAAHNDPVNRDNVITFRDQLNAGRSAPTIRSLRKGPFIGWASNGEACSWDKILANYDRHGAVVVGSTQVTGATLSFLIEAWRTLSSSRRPSWLHSHPCKRGLNSFPKA